MDDSAWTDAQKNSRLAEVDIFADLTAAEMHGISAAAPMRTYRAGEVLYSPGSTGQTLFILKTGRVRLFRSSADGRVLTTAVIAPGTVFGDMVPLGQRMDDNHAEALEESVVCVMGRADVQRFLLSDARIAARIAAILGTRLLEAERRLSDSVFKTVPQRVAATLLTLTTPDRRRPRLLRAPSVPVTHEQLAALVGTSRESATKALGDLAHLGLVRLGRGRITVLDRDGLDAAAGG